MSGGDGGIKSKVRHSSLLFMSETIETSWLLLPHT